MWAGEGRHKKNTICSHGESTLLDFSSLWLYPTRTMIVSSPVSSNGYKKLARNRQVDRHARLSITHAKRGKVDPIGIEPRDPRRRSRLRCAKRFEDTTPPPAARGCSPLRVASALWLAGETDSTTARPFSTHHFRMYHPPRGVTVSVMVRRALGFPWLGSLVAPPRRQQDAARAGTIAPATLRSVVESGSLRSPTACGSGIPPAPPSAAASWSRRRRAIFPLCGG